MTFGHKKRKPLIGRDKTKLMSDCIQCRSHRTVALKIKRKDEKVTAVGRCSECGFYTQSYVLDEKTFESIKPSVLEEIIPLQMTPEEELEDVSFDEEVITTLTGPGYPE